MLASTVAAVLAILLFVVPTLAPLVQQSGAAPPLSLAVLLWASGALSANLATLGAFGAAAVIVLVILARLGVLSEPLDLLLLDGPGAQIRRGLVFGAFTIVLGDMLASGAPLSDALRAGHTHRSFTSRPRAAGPGRRPGAPGPAPLQRSGPGPRVPAPAVVRMCAVGESSGQLGQMLVRAGRLEEETALRKVEAVGRILGPLLIVLLGAPGRPADGQPAVGSQRNRAGDQPSERTYRRRRVRHHLGPD